MGKRLDGLPPIAEEGTVAVVLGTFPGPEALARHEYYADPRNQFWAIMDRLLGPLLELDCCARTAAILDRRIGLWDVIGSCEREGAQDRKIRSPEPNDLADFLDRHRLVRVVFFNGQEAERHFNKFRGDGRVEVLTDLSFETLPSSSGANTHMTVEEKAKYWRRCLAAHGI